MKMLFRLPGQMTFVLSLIIIAFLNGCQQQTENSITEKEAMILLNKLMEIHNEGNLSLADEILDSNCVLSYPVLPESIIGIEGFKNLMTNTKTAFPDFHGSIEELIVDGDRIWSRYTITGTNSGPFGEFPPTGKTFKITGLAITRVFNGKIIEDRTFWNVLDFYQQLGFTLTPPKE